MGHRRQKSKSLGPCFWPSVISSAAPPSRVTPPSWLPVPTGFGRTGVEAVEAPDLPAAKVGSDERRLPQRGRRLAVRGEVRGLTRLPPAVRPAPLQPARSRACTEGGPRTPRGARPSRGSPKATPQEGGRLQGCNQKRNLTPMHGDPGRGSGSDIRAQKGGWGSQRCDPKTAREGPRVSWDVGEGRGAAQRPCWRF